MDDFVVLRKVRLLPQHTPTDKTRHYRYGKELPTPAELWIGQYSGDAGYYLIYLDSEGNELTDTYHDTLEGALKQAMWEFRVPFSDWEVLDVEL